MKKNLFLSALMAFVFLLSACSPKPAEAQGPEIRASFAKVCITPESDFTIMSYITVLNGKYPDDILDDIYARILVLETDAKRMVYINAEVALLEEGRTLSGNFRQNISDLYGVAVDDVILTSTHNHQSLNRLSATEEKKIVDAVGAAVKTLQPVKIGAETLVCPYGVSRSPDYRINENGPYDSLVTVVRFDRISDGKPVGMLYSFPVHNTMLGNDAPQYRNYLSKEFTGFASQFIEKQMGEPFVSIFIVGFTGNAGPYFNGQYHLTYEELTAAGDVLGQFVLESCNAIETSAGGEVVSAFNVTRLETNQEDNAWKDYFNSSRYKDFKVYCSAFSDVAVVGVNAEVFNITGAHLRAEAPYRYVIHTSGVDGWLGYIPTYETFHSGLNEQECTPVKTPFTDRTEQFVYEALLNDLCALAGKQVDKRIYPEEAAPVLEKGAATYAYDFGETLTADKVIIDCGQSERADCPCDFTLRLLDEEGIAVLTRQYTDNSVNYLGIFTEDVSFSKAEITVTSSYKSQKPVESLPIKIYALTYKPLE